MKASDFDIGNVVEFDSYYSAAAKRRFRNGPTAEAESGNITSGRVVGIRSIIIDEYKVLEEDYSISPEGREMYYPPLATGTRETVLLVAANIRQKPFIVRLDDVRSCGGIPIVKAENARLRAALEEVDSLVDSLVCEEDAEAILRDISGVVCCALKGEAGE